MKYKNFLPLLILSGLLAFGCQNVVKVEEGVSKGLAENRKEHISNIQYSLFFNIPLQRDSAVKGRVSISFDNTSDRLPQIDFKAPNSSITRVTLNGEDVTYIYIAEHIIIKGDAPSTRTTIEVDFIAPDQSLNRRDELLYTLLVPDRARTLFPCFDQPDLKGRYSLTMELPSQWIAVSNSAESEIVTDGVEKGRKRVVFIESEPLSTYLFSFVCGDFKKESATANGRTISMYHRETDSKKIAQISSIFKEVFEALSWLENYTAIDYPFSKYDFIVLPGFQYGGMEHTGATLYNDRRIFLNEGAGLQEEMNRYALITHETSHMWFGDLVTMCWFDDVWTKEVYANYFSALMLSEKFPSVERDMNFVDYASSSYSEDRTRGANPIKQDLDNLNNAGLVYGNIIYNKSPIVMEMLVKKIGAERFRQGIQSYLKQYAYSNASWDDLIGILDALSDEDLTLWSEAWVNRAGMPIINVETSDDNQETLTISQTDMFGQKVVRPQMITLLLKQKEHFDTLIVNLLDQKSILQIKDVEGVVPNIDAAAYGYFKLGERDRNISIERLFGEASQVESASTLLNLYENWYQGNYPSEEYLAFMYRYLQYVDDQILFSYLTSHLSSFINYNGEASEIEFENRLWEIVTSKKNEQNRRRAFSVLYRGMAMNTPLSQKLLNYFNAPESFTYFKLTESDLISLSYELAIRYPNNSDEIVSTQREKITNPDRKKQYDFISAAVSSNEDKLDSFFESLLDEDNRSIEPWASSALSYLNHPLRAERSFKYITPGLEEMQEIHNTGDIFFPKSWVSSLLRGHTEKEALFEVDKFLRSHPDYPLMLKRKILQSANHPQ